jgi:hypothetical protein
MMRISSVVWSMSLSYHGKPLKKPRRTLEPGLLNAKTIKSSAVTRGVRRGVYGAEPANKTRARLHEFHEGRGPGQIE